MILTLYFIIAAATAAVVVYQYFLWQSQYWKRRGIPGPSTRLFYGNMKELNNFDDPMPMKIHQWTKKFGNVYGYKEGVRNVLVTSDLNMINEVFVKQFDSFYARRKIRPIVEDSAMRLVDLMEKRHAGGESFNVARFFSEYTLDAICRLVLGQKESNLFNNPRIDVVQALFLQNLDRPLFHLATGIPPVGRAIRNLASKFNVQTNEHMNMISKEIATTVNQKVEERSRSGPPSAPADFIDLFLDNAAEFDYQNRGEFSTLDSVTKALTVDEVIAQAVVFLLAGYDTTSNALSYTAWMLSRNPEIMKRCQEEVDEVCTDSSISYEDCQNMRYLDAVCRETLRFFPLAARAVARTCMKDTTVGDYDIEQGTIVLADTFAVHFSKELWGEDADEFRPERWLESDKRVAAINFLTFGAGPRLCIGMRLATMEEKIVLAHLLRRFDVVADENVSELKLVGSLTTTPEAVPVKIRPRV
ncbi:hypothetical protein PRIPAC_91662 [Pristionchus pacificus]|uniref:Cytochrome P450 n=1 Tax=Pristionchus pacificus TaxID=54126 RepID=A0A2A6BJ90_PRIPA|nr:hypothetical protein PRIPAC_91662 [Pristionchus pacificus]|eukprot:PDM65898.1 cytochrome P450 [Pristionchus pacificus]